jgi:hypothetical protein
MGVASMKPIPAPVALGDIIQRLQSAENDVAVAIIMSTRIVNGHVMARRHDLHAAAARIKVARFAAEDWLEFCERQDAMNAVPTV